MAFKLLNAQYVHQPVSDCVCLKTCWTGCVQWGFTAIFLKRMLWEQSEQTSCDLSVKQILKLTIKLYKSERKRRFRWWFSVDSTLRATPFIFSLNLSLTFFFCFFPNNNMGDEVEKNRKKSSTEQAAVSCINCGFIDISVSFPSISMQKFFNPKGSEHPPCGTSFPPSAGNHIMLIFWPTLRTLLGLVTSSSASSDFYLLLIFHPCPVAALTHDHMFSSSLLWSSSSVLFNSVLLEVFVHMVDVLMIF